MISSSQQTVPSIFSGQTARSDRQSTVEACPVHSAPIPPISGSLKLANPAPSTCTSRGKSPCSGAWWRGIGSKWDSDERWRRGDSGRANWGSRGLETDPEGLGRRILEIEGAPDEWAARGPWIRWGVGTLGKRFFGGTPAGGPWRWMGGAAAEIGCFNGFPDFFFWNFENWFFLNFF